MMSRLAVTAILVLASGAAMADPLPLRHGAYVAADTDCKDPPNAAIQTYDGSGIGTSKADGCRTHVASRQGDTYQIEQSCQQKGGPGLGRAAEHYTIRVDGPDRYTDLTGGSGTSFRLCPNLKP